MAQIFLRLPRTVLASGYGEEGQHEEPFRSKRAIDRGCVRTRLLAVELSGFYFGREGARAAQARIAAIRGCAPRIAIIRFRL